MKSSMAVHRWNSGKHSPVASAMVAIFFTLLSEFAPWLSKYTHSFITIQLH